MQVTAQKALGGLVLMLIVGGCVGRGSGAERAFFQLPPLERNDSIANLPIERQLDLYVYGVKRVIPPATHLAHPIAAQGTRIVREVMDRIRMEGDDGVRVRLLYVLSLVGCPDRQVVAAHIGELEEIGRGIKSAYARSDFHEFLKRIRDPCPEQ